MHKGNRPFLLKQYLLFIECLTLEYLLQKESCTISISGVYLYPNIMWMTWHLEGLNSMSHLWLQRSRL